MTDRAQFEAMLEALVNEDHEAAKDIFHNIVVAKSREIYEELLAEDFDLLEAEEEEEEEEGAEDDSADDSENPFGSEEDDSEDDAGDASDDFASDDSEEDDFDGEEEEGDLEDRVLDLEDALEELKAEFDSLMADEAGEEEHTDGMNDPEFGGEEDEFGGDEFGGEEDEFGGEEDEFGEDGMEEAPKKIIHYHVEGNPEESLGEDEFMQFMEYVNKVALPKHGDNGVNTKSVVDNMKNDMGGTSANILNGGTESPTFANKGQLKGNGVFKGTPTEDNFGNINVPGGKAGKTGFKTREPGHGAEKKGKSETAANKQSIIGSRK